MSEITQILQRLDRGDPQAADQLLARVYEELRWMAEAQLNNEQPGQTLQPTALVHEAYLRMLGDQKFDNRGHFLGIHSKLFCPASS
jgi:DNA-directed RNA polymerase specialized sigma24 family protein